MPPPFDLEAYARDGAMRDSERKVPSERPTEPAPVELESNTRLRTHAPTAVTHLPTIELRAALADEFFEGNYATALALADELVSRRPEDSSARDYGDECRRMLEKQLLHRIGGSVVRVPVLAIAMRDLPTHKLDHKAGFVVSRVDGELSIEGLLDVGAMPRLDALKIIADLVEAGVLRLRGQA
jgi:hypothetical protein